LLGQNKKYDVKKAIRNGVTQYILSRQPFDLKEEEERLGSWRDKTESGYQIEEHHVIPLALSSSEDDPQEIRDVPNHILNSPLNLTPVSNEANSSLATFSPEETLSTLPSAHTARHSLPPNKFEDIGFDSDHEDIEGVLMDRYSKLKQDIGDEVLDLSSS